MLGRLVLGRLAVAATVATLFVATDASAGTDAFDDHEPDPDGVYGGGPVSACEWPTTVSLGGCTGTLVHPEVVIYAAHCGGVSSVFFGDSVHQTGRSVTPEFCRTYSGGGPGNGRDWAFCKLAQPVTDIPITPPLMGCEVDLLVEGAPVWIVGFGNTDDGNFGVKYEAQTEFHYIQNDEAFVGGGGIDTCQGDSGGPVYIQAQDGSWRAFGITSYGNGCGGGGWYSMMHTGIDWFESESGVDITPCHDADGTWNPGPDCGGFPTEPMTASGSWPNSCDGGQTLTWSDSCGPPHAVEDDLDAPTVSIVSPADGARYDSDPGTGRAEVTVQIMADDAAGSGVREVQLLINGTALMTPATEAPYEFNVNLGAGGYTLSAIAVDYADNSTESAAINVGIDEEPPGADSGDSGDSAGDSDGDGDGDGDSGDDGLDDGGIDTRGALPADWGGDATQGCACNSSGSSPVSLLFFVLVGLRIRRRDLTRLRRRQ